MKMYRKQFIEKTKSLLPNDYFGSDRYPKHDTAEIVKALKKAGVKARVSEKDGYPCLEITKSAFDSAEMKKFYDTAHKRTNSGRKAFETRMENICEETGALPHSRTAMAVALGQLDIDEAKRIAEICRYRHEETNYDALLNEGLSKEDARAMMQPLVKESA